jgi:hypothetical protein
MEKEPTDLPIRTGINGKRSIKFSNIIFVLGQLTLSITRPKYNALKDSK